MPIREAVIEGLWTKDLSRRLAGSQAYDKAACLVKYALAIGMRHLRSKKRPTVSMISLIAIVGVALGVAALSNVLAITSGFQREIKAKVLGVNAHVLVLRYGLDFDQYRDVIGQVLEDPDVVGAGPFLINEMMLAKGDRLAGILVKGVDPQAMLEVLDVPSQIVAGSLEGLRVPGSLAPLRPDDLSQNDDGDLDEFLRGLTDAGLNEGSDASLNEGSDAGVGLSDGGPSVSPEASHRLNPDHVLPRVPVRSPAEVERALQALEALESGDGLPSDVAEQEMLDREREASEADSALASTRSLPGIVVGLGLATQLGLEVGDRVKIISPLTGVDVSHFGIRTPQSRDFRVIGVFEAGFNEYDSRLVYVDLFEAQRFQDHGDSVTGVEIRLHDFEKAPEVSKRLQRELGHQYNTMDWSTLNHNLFTALFIQQVILSITIATIVFVAAFNVIATLIMMVLEKKRDIAILKAMGATNGRILLIFFMQGATIGIIGTAIGLILGFGITWLVAHVGIPLDPKVYLIDHVPVSDSTGVFWVTAAIALTICFTATIFPALWAARMQPAEGVRYE